MLRYKQASPTSCNTTTTTLGPLPPLSFHHPHHLHHHNTLPHQPLHPAHLVSPPHHLHHLHHTTPAGGPFQRTGTLPPNYSLGTLPHPGHHPRSVSCDHTSGGPPHPRPGYVTLPRRPRASWAGVRDTPSPSASASSMAAPRDPVYDGVGPRTSADGSSKLREENRNFLKITYIIVLASDVYRRLNAPNFQCDRLFIDFFVGRVLKNYKTDHSAL